MHGANARPSLNGAQYPNAVMRNPQETALAEEQLLRRTAIDHLSPEQKKRDLGVNAEFTFGDDAQRAVPRQHVDGGNERVRPSTIGDRHISATQATRMLPPLDTRVPRGRVKQEPKPNAKKGVGAVEQVLRRISAHCTKSDSQFADRPVTQQHPRCNRRHASPALSDPQATTHTPSQQRPSLFSASQNTAGMFGMQVSRRPNRSSSRHGRSVAGDLYRQGAVNEAFPAAESFFTHDRHAVFPAPPQITQPSAKRGPYQR